MTTNTWTKLSLKLKPETAKIMDWIVAAKMSGDPKQQAWAKNEFETASERARERERAEEALREREARFAFWREQERLTLELEEREREAECEAKFAEVRGFQAFWAQRGYHVALEEGCEAQPTQSSQKGWRRLLSEHDDLCDWRRYGQWGRTSYRRNSGHRSAKHNCGRKPRKSWFK